MVSARLPVLLRGGDTDRTAALRIAFVGTFPPTQCGLATFTESLVDSISYRAGRAVEPVVIRLIQPNEPTGGAARPTVDWIAGDAASFDQVRATVEDVGVVILQHEYGIYGGPDGDEVLDLLRTTTTPSIVVLHTVLAEPTPHQRAVLEEVIARTDVTVTQTEAARVRLANYAITDPERVIVIPHGAWTEPTGEGHRPERPLVLSWGLVGPGKGLEHGIAAMARLGDLTPAPRYLIAGETHPKVRAAQGERYREMLARSAVERGVADRVVFDATYRDVSSLAALIGSADVVLLPYDSPDQVTSGVLVEALAAGKPVVATTFPHAVEALASGAGLLVGHGDDQAMADALRRILTRPDVADAMRREAARVGADLRWPVVAQRYLTVIHDLLADRVAA